MRSAPIIWLASIRNNFYEGKFEGSAFIVLGQHFSHAGDSDEGAEGGTDVGAHQGEKHPVETNWTRARIALAATHA